MTSQSFNNKQVISAFTDHEPIFISNDDNFTDYGFPGEGTISTPYLIEEYRIISSSVYGIYITSTTKHFIIRNCYIDVNTIGISILNIAIQTASIINNTCCHHNYYGITLGESDSGIVKDNICYDNQYGIYIYDSENTLIKNNTCYNNDYGIYEWETTACETSQNYCYDNIQGMYIHTCSDFYIKDNICNDNTEEGIYITTMANTVTLMNNSCNNNEDGITIVGSDCILKENLLKLNSGYGIWLEGPSIGNTVHHNKFVDNKLSGGSQARDDGIQNIWYDTTTNEGNWWNDYSGTGNYTIDGSRNSKDPYPLTDVTTQTTPEPTETRNDVIFVFTAIFFSVIFIYQSRKKWKN